LRYRLQYGVYLDLIFFSYPSILRVSGAETPLLKLDRQHQAFVLTCDIEYLKYVSMCRRVVLILVKPMSTESFCNYRPLNDQIIFEATVSTSAFRSKDPKYIVKNSTVKYPWFDRELHNVDNNKKKAYTKYSKELETLHVRPMSNSNQCLYYTALHRFRELRRDFKSLHPLKYAQFIVRIEDGLKNTPRG
jgi:hypothetical protein